MTRIASQVSDAQWSHLQAQTAVPLQQSNEYGEVCKALGREVVRMKVSQGETPAYAQFIVRAMLGRRRFALSSAGPVWPNGVGESAQLWNSFQEGLGMARLSALVTTPRCNATVAGLPIMSAATIAEVDLSQSQLQQRMAMKGKWRNRLVRDEREGCNVQQVSADTDIVEKLLNADVAQQKDHRYRSLPPAFLRVWAQTFPEKTHIFLSGTASKTNAAMVFLRHGACATYFLGWRDPLSKHAAHNLILWRAMQFLSQKGVRRLDLGTIDTVNTPGIARFKLGSGAQVRRLGKTYWIK